MASLARDLRKDLERTVKQARRVAEAGAQKVMDQLGVHHHEPYGSMSAEERALRNRLRAHGRQLGDHRDRQKGTQTVDRLLQECAYEHWHRMLFARFLAETDLLIEPKSGVAITLEDCQELAREEGADWLALASDYAERMLPQIFRTDDPVLAVTLPPETRSELEDLLKSLPRDVFTADDSLGWVYQFWQAKKKEEVNRSEIKIGADELPAVTQLFTEDYMVLFLLHNTLGAWWAGKVLAGNPDIATSAQSEDELRATCRVGDVEWTYLRFMREKAEDGDQGPWRPAAGTFKGWPTAAKDLTVLDPCMGSGHFLVFALPILAAFRMAEEELSETEAVDAVLCDNLFGLEIDPRCTQIAAFNLAFAAWRKIGYRTLPQLNLACSGLAIGVTKAEWLKLAEKAVTAADPDARRDLFGVENNLLTHGLEERAKNGLEVLYDLFGKAPWLGSLLDLRSADADIFREGFDKLEPLLSSILWSADSDDAVEMAVTAKGMAKAAQILSSDFTVTATNVPYLSRGKQEPILANYLSNTFSDGKTDLATAFLLRILRASSSGRTAAIVLPENWQYQDQYNRLRESIFSRECLRLAARLGPGAFDGITGEVVKASLCIFCEDLDDAICGISLHESPGILNKITDLKGKPFLRLIPPPKGAKNNSLIISEEPRIAATLGDYAAFNNGVCAGDQQKFSRKFWELPAFDDRWAPLQSTVKATTDFGGMEDAFLWDHGRGEFYEFVRERLGVEGVASWIRGGSAWGHQGILVSAMGSLQVSLYLGTLFNDNCVAIIPENEEDLGPIWAFCSSPDYYKSVREIDTSLKVRGPLIRVSFDKERWLDKFKNEYPEGLRKPASGVPTNWIFDGDPAAATTALHVTVARLLGYRWPRQTGSSFMDCPSLAPDGLQIHADDDGIVCLTAQKGETPAEQRLNALLADAFGTVWSAAKLASLLADVGFAGKSIDDWLRDGFFEQHCTLFQQRPFIWHIWDGRRDGFHALVNYHRLATPNGEGRRTLEKLIYSYLGDWIDHQRADQKAGVEGADARVTHAEHLRDELINILKGEPPYDIFVRWKPLHLQPIGWDPDINDGVRMNIRPFMTSRPLGARAKSACILRSTPKIKWTKDRGKEPIRDKEDYPWFWGWDEAASDFAGGEKFDGNRWNDLHYSNSFKQAARARRATEVEGNT